MVVADSPSPPLCIRRAGAKPCRVRADVKAVRRMLGHAKASMTLDTYEDLFDEVADRLNDAIRVTADALRTAQVP